MRAINLLRFAFLTLISLRKVLLVFSRKTVTSMDSRTVDILYSGKLSWENTFASFEVL